MLQSLAERGLLPDPLVRFGIRRLLRERLDDERRGGPAAVREARRALVDRMKESAIAVATREANEQHYELPAEFFELILGPRLKYSACAWPDGCDGLPAAEEATLRLTATRAGIEDGMEILDLGCGWGSFSLWAGEHYPAARILAVSNSAGQRESIRAAASERGLANVEAETADINGFDPSRRFDRVVSVEMFEHTRNYEHLLRNIASWLRADGRLFVQMFCHRELAYFYEDDGPGDWMARHFFTGGMMPGHDLLDEFAEDLEVERRWSLDGRDYARTLEAWLMLLDAHPAEIREIFRRVYGAEDAGRWIHRWRMFLMACAELFRYRGGSEWFVGHYLLRPARSE